MNDNVLRFPATAGARGAVAPKVDATEVRQALLAVGADLRLQELAVIAWATRVAEGISTICLRDGASSLSMSRAYKRFKDLAYLADLTGSIARYAHSGRFPEEMREAFLGIVVENLIVVASRYWEELPEGWYAAVELQPLEKSC